MNGFLSAAGFPGLFGAMETISEADGVDNLRIRTVGVPDGLAGALGLPFRPRRNEPSATVKRPDRSQRIPRRQNSRCRQSS